jgi:hypothetical protein
MTTHTHSLRYSGPEREQRSRLKVTKEGLGTILGLGLRVGASTYGFSVAFLETMLNLVLLTSWVSSLGDFILTIDLTDTLT